MFRNTIVTPLVLLLCLTACRKPSPAPQPCAAPEDAVLVLEVGAEAGTPPVKYLDYASSRIEVISRETSHSAKQALPLVPKKAPNSPTTQETPVEYQVRFNYTKTDEKTLYVNVAGNLQIQIHNDPSSFHNWNVAEPGMKLFNEEGGEFITINRYVFIKLNSSDFDTKLIDADPIRDISTRSLTVWNFSITPKHEGLCTIKILLASAASRPTNLDSNYVVKSWTVTVQTQPPPTWWGKICALIANLTTITKSLIEFLKQIKYLITATMAVVVLIYMYYKKIKKMIFQRRTRSAMNSKRSIPS